MSCFAWTCRGLGNLRTGRELVEITWAKDPSVVFVAETLTDDARLEIVQRSIEHDHRWVFKGKVKEVVWLCFGSPPLI